MNKHLLTSFGFKNPVVMTLCHMIFCSLFSYFTAVVDVFPSQKVQNQTQVLKIGALALVFVFSIVMGNISLKYIPVSFNQAIGSTTPFFTAVLAAVIQGITGREEEKETLNHACEVEVRCRIGSNC